MCMSRPSPPPPTPRPAPAAAPAADVKPSLESGADSAARKRRRMSSGSKKFRVNLSLSPGSANVGGSGLTGLNIPKIRG